MLRLHVISQLDHHTSLDHPSLRGTAPLVGLVPKLNVSPTHAFLSPASKPVDGVNRLTPTSTCKVKPMGKPNGRELVGSTHSPSWLIQCCPHATPHSADARPTLRTARILSIEPVCPWLRSSGPLPPFRPLYMPISGCHRYPPQVAPRILSRHADYSPGPLYCSFVPRTNDLPHHDRPGSRPTG